jgi:hypothetical protein
MIPKKISKNVLIAAGVVTVAMGAAAVFAVANRAGTGELVSESAAQYRLGAGGSAAREAKAPGVQVSYLDTLSEPSGGSRPYGAKPAAAPSGEPSRGLASLAVSPPSPVLPSPAPEKTEAAPAQEAKGGDCRTGSRPIGDCNCIDESRGRIFLHQHPTQACVEEESRRLGHQVILSNDDGSMELAGEQPVRAPEVPLVIASDPLAASQASAIPVSPVLNGEIPAATPSSAQPQTIPAANATNAVICSSDPSAATFNAQFASLTAAYQATMFNLNKKMAEIPGPSKGGTCPAGAKPEICRCELRTPGKLTYVPASGAPAFCSDTSIQANLSKPEDLGPIMLAFSRFNSSLSSQRADLVKQQATAMATYQANVSALRSQARGVKTNCKVVKR